MTDATLAAPRVAGVTVGPFQENTYLVVDPATGHAALVDPGDEGARVVAMVRQAGVTLDAVWLTHAHIDHVGAVAAVQRAFDVPVLLHPADRWLYENVPVQAQMFGVPTESPPPFDRELADGEVLALGALHFTVMHVPGHAPGHCIFHGHGVALAGDLIFAGSIGRTDLPMSDPRDMQRSLERAMAELADDVVLYPGHGPATRMGDERVSNPFLTGAARVVGGG